jgi:hypothetical protein
MRQYKTLLIISLSGMENMWDSGSISPESEDNADVKYMGACICMGLVVFLLSHA